MGPGTGQASLENWTNGEFRNRLCFGPYRLNNPEKAGKDCLL